MVSNYLLNFYLFEVILTKLQRTLIKISKQGIFMFSYNILLMESFFCHQTIMISLELCLDLKIFHFFKNWSYHYTKVSHKKKKMYHRKLITHYLSLKIKSWDQFTHISHINLFYENTMSIITKKNKNK